jgi:hypothetical protein
LTPKRKSLPLPTEENKNMAMQDAIHQNAGLRDTFSRSAARAPPEIKIISHSNIFYWWPAWVAGFAVAMISYTQGRDVAIVPEIIDRVHPGNNPGFSSSRFSFRLSSSPPPSFAASTRSSLLSQ